MISGRDSTAILGVIVGTGCFRVCNLLEGSYQFRFREESNVKLLVDGTHWFLLVWKQGRNYPTPQFRAGQRGHCSAPRLTIIIWYSSPHGSSMNMLESSVHVGRVLLIKIFSVPRASLCRCFMASHVSPSLTL